MTQKNVSSASGPASADAPNQNAAPQSGNTQLALIYATCGVLGLLGPQKHDKATREHGYQALFTCFGFLAVHGIFGILGGTFLLLKSMTDLAGVGFTLFQVFRAYQNKPIKIPVISAMARKQAEPSPDSNHTQE